MRAVLLAYTFQAIAAGFIGTYVIEKYFWLILEA